MNSEKMLKLTDFLLREYKFLRRNETFNALNHPMVRQWLEIKKIRRDQVEGFLPFNVKGFLHGNGRKMPSYLELQKDIIEFIKENS